MTDTALTQEEADTLLAIEKRCLETYQYVYPFGGGCLNIPLHSVDGREKFHLDIRRFSINISKGTYQNRAKVSVVLARLDFEGAPHTNPDGNRIPCPHIHLYRDGFGDKWAYPLDEGFCENPADAWDLLQGFWRRCNITVPPVFKPQLMS